MTTFAELKAKARPAQRFVDLCVDRQLNAEHDLLDLELRQAVTRPHETLADGADQHETAEKIRALEDRMAQSQDRFWVQALPERAFLAVLDEHPARDGNARDASRGYNYDTFPPAVIARAMIDPPEGQHGVDKLTEDELTELFHDILSAADASKLLQAATVDNVIPSSIPFSELASAILRETAQS